MAPLPPPLSKSNTLDKQLNLLSVRMVRMLQTQWPKQEICDPDGFAKPSGSEIYCNYLAPLACGMF